MKRCQASQGRKVPRPIRDIPPQSAAAVVRIAARQRARLHHISKSNSSKIILTISKTLKQSLFLQLHRLNTYFLKHIHHQIFNSSTQSGMPNAEYRMTGNVRHVLSHCFQYQLRAMREIIPSEAVFHNQSVSCGKNFAMNL